MEQKYFALEEPKKLVAALNAFTDKWETNIGHSANGLAAIWQRNANAYYANILDGGDVGTSLSLEGSQGELVKMLVPQARSVFRQFLGLITKDRLDFKTVAQSSDTKTLNGSRLGDAIAEQVVKNHRMDAKRERLVEEAGMAGASFTKTTWRSDKGEAKGRNPDSGEPYYEGDIDIEIVSAQNVLYDFSVVDFDDLDWVLVRTKKNKWDLISQHPNLRDEILRVPAIDHEASNESTFFGLSQTYEDSIYVYEFYHKDSPAVSGGRFAAYASPDCIFTDGENPYGFIPLEPMIPEKILYTGLGYPFFSNLLPLQEILDATISIIATNQQAFGVQSILVPKNADISVNDMGPLKFLNYTPQNAAGGGEPKPLQLTATPPEVFKFMDVLMRHMNEISLVSSVLRGQPPQGVTAASAIATLSANSLQTLDGFSKTLSICLENTMSKVLKIYQKFAETPRLVEMLGPRKTYVIKEFTGDDLAAISRVRMVISNPLAATPGGRREIAESLLKTGMIKKPEQYFTVLETGNLDVIYDDQVDEMMCIESENDMLREGQKPIAVMIDDHAAHIMSHKSVLNDPMVRYQSGMVQSTLDHIEEHVNLARNADPFLTAMLLTGKNPPPPPPQPPQMMGAMPPQDQQEAEMPPQQDEGVVP